MPGGHLKRGFIELTKVKIWACQQAAKDLSSFDHLNHRFNDLKKVAFSVGKEGNNDFNVTFENLNHRFFEFIEIAFLAVQEAENEFAMSCNH